MAGSRPKAVNQFLTIKYQIVMTKPELIKAIEKYISGALEKENLDVSGLDNKELRKDAAEWLDHIKDMYSVGLDTLDELED